MSYIKVILFLKNNIVKMTFSLKKKNVLCLLLINKYIINIIPFITYLYIQFNYNIYLKLKIL